MGVIVFSRYQLRPISFERTNLRDFEYANAKHVGPCVSPPCGPQIWRLLKLKWNINFRYGIQ